MSFILWYEGRKVSGPAKRKGLKGTGVSLHGHVNGSPQARFSIRGPRGWISLIDHDTGESYSGTVRELKKIAEDLSRGMEDQ